MNVNSLASCNGRVSDVLLEDLLEHLGDGRGAVLELLALLGLDGEDGDGKEEHNHAVHLLVCEKPVRARFGFQRGAPTGSVVNTAQNGCTKRGTRTRNLRPGARRSC